MMRYILVMDIALPRDQVVALFADPQNWRYWQETLLSYEVLDENTEDPGTKTKIRH